MADDNTSRTDEPNMTSMALAESALRTTDEALAAAAKAGDREAFESLVERYRDVVFAYAYARLRTRDEAEDIAQEAFVRALMSLSRFNVRASWAPWIMSITRNLCHDALRRKMVRGDQTPPVEWVDHRPTPELQAISKERSELLRAAVAELPEKYRTPLLMHYASKRTNKEIALALGLPVSTIIGRLAQALRLMRRKMVD